MRSIVMAPEEGDLCRNPIGNPLGLYVYDPEVLDVYNKPGEPP